MKKLTLLLSLVVWPLFSNTTLNNQLIPTITTTSTQILVQNYARTYLLIVNPSTNTNTIYVKGGSVHAGLEGVPIPPGGAWEPISPTSDSIWIKTGAGTASISVTTGIER